MHVWTGSGDNRTNARRIEICRTRPVKDWHVEIADTEPNVQIAKLLEHFGANGGEFEGGVGLQRARPIDVAQMLPIDFGPQNEHRILGIESFPNLVEC